VTTALLQQQEEDTRSRSVGDGPQARAYALPDADPPGRPHPGAASTTWRSRRGPDATTGSLLRVYRIRVLLVLALVLACFLGGPQAAWAAPPSAPWGWPLPGTPEVTRAFQPPPTPYAAGHRGADLAGAAGAPVLAAGAGVVAFAGLVAGRPVVSVQHTDGLRTTYEPVQPTVAAGQVVTRGSPLGSLVAGHPGCPVEACLHWGLRRGEVYLDPLALLRPPRIRLLPWN
jgi:murein DD-endopeptidase MepM/ murein hydrolase activator NlpD